MTDAEYLTVRDRAARRLLAIPNVTGVGLGGRRRHGQPTGEVVLKVFVRRKRPSGELRPDELIPAFIEGLPTDVCELGPPVPMAHPPGAKAPASMEMDETPTMPLQGGMSIAMDAHTNGGTLGCFLRDRNDSTAVYGLTNYHVAAKDLKLSRSWRALRPIQPPPSNLHERFATAEGGGSDAYRDAALLRLDAGVKWLPSIKEIGFIRGAHQVTVAEAAPLNYQVRKRGARTKITGGIVEAVSVVIDFQPRTAMVIRPNPDPVFADQQVVFSYFGDSGSVVVNDSNEVVALLFASEEGNATLLHAYVTSIGVLLERFKAVEGLDLGLPIVDPSKPETEADQTLTVPPPAGAKLKAVPQMIARTDSGYYRPLIGGSQLLAAPMLGAANAATLGCILTDPAHPGSAWALTCYGNLTANGTIPPTSDTKVGQPDNHSSISGCCSNTVAHFAIEGATPDAPMAAIVKLEDDQRWLPELLRIGIIPDPPISILSTSMTVRKHGAETRLTGGKVIAVGGFFGTLPSGISPDAILVAPNADPLQPDAELCFSQPVDRGALVVNDDAQVLGMLYGEVDIPDANGRRMLHGVAAPIQTVLDALNQAAGLNLAIASTNSVNHPETTHARTREAPSARPAEPARDWLDEVRRDELVRSASGRWLAGRWHTHQQEMSRLIAGNRKVAAVWHRSGGPALLQAVAATMRNESTTMPSLVNGVPLRASIDRIAAILCRYGSAQLRADLGLLQARIPSVEGLTARDFLAAVAEAFESLIVPEPLPVNG